MKSAAKVALFSSSFFTFHREFRHKKKPLCAFDVCGWLCLIISNWFIFWLGEEQSPLCFFRKCWPLYISDILIRNNSIIQIDTCSSLLHRTFSIFDGALSFPFLIFSVVLNYIIPLYINSGLTSTNGATNYVDFHHLYFKICFVGLQFPLFFIFCSIIIAVRWLHAKECTEHAHHQFCTLSFVSKRK